MPRFLVAASEVAGVPPAHPIVAQLVSQGVTELLAGVWIGFGDLEDLGVRGRYQCGRRGQCGGAGEDRAAGRCVDEMRGLWGRAVWTSKGGMCDSTHSPPDR